MVTTNAGAACCCPSEPRYNLLFNCCDYSNATPLVAVRNDIFETLRRQCDPEWFPGRAYDMVLRVQGRRTCYTPGTLSPSITRAQAVERELIIVEDPAIIACVPQDDTFPENQCYTESCPICPRDCCIVNHFKHDCADIDIVVMNNSNEPDPKRNRCCVYGRKVDFIWTTNIRETSEDFEAIQGWLDTSVPPLNYCPPGCYAPLLTRREITVQRNRERHQHTQCDTDGTLPPIPTVCMEREQQFTRDGFVRVRRQPGNCLNYVDDPFSERFIDTECRPLIGLRVPLPPAFGRAVRLPPVLNFDGTIFTQIAETPGLLQSPNYQCVDLVNHRSILKSLVDRDVWTETEFITTFRYGVGCFSGSSLFDQMRITRAYGFGCPPDGAITQTYRRVVEKSYSIRTLAVDLCDRRVCEGFRTGTPTAPFPFPLPPPPLTENPGSGDSLIGGLELL